MSNDVNIAISGQNTSRHLTPEQLARQCLAEAGGNPDKAIALAGKRLREIYLAQIKRAGSDYFARVKRVSVTAIDAFNSRQK